MILESSKKRIWLEESCKRRCEKSEEIQESIEKESQSSIGVSLEIKHDLHENITDIDKQFCKFIQDAIEMAQTNIKKNFEGGRIKHFSNQRKEITSDKEILKIVNGIELEFDHNTNKNSKTMSI